MSPFFGLRNLILQNLPAPLQQSGSAPDLFRLPRFYAHYLQQSSIFTCSALLLLRYHVPRTRQLQPGSVALALHKPSFNAYNVRRATSDCRPATRVPCTLLYLRLSSKFTFSALLGLCWCLGQTYILQPQIGPSFWLLSFSPSDAFPSAMQSKNVPLPARLRAHCLRLSSIFTFSALLALCRCFPQTRQCR